jgi:diphthine synthase
MLWFVGTGINGYRGLSIAAVDVLNKCHIVYVERFTSGLSEDDLEGLNSILSIQVKPVERWFVEDGREILEAARTKDVALMSYGDPLIATTHIELRARAANNSVKTAVLHAASGILSIIGEAGLHVYKIGRIVTMMSGPYSAISVYNTIFENLLVGSHTLILTEYSHNDENKEPFFLDPTSVFKMLLDAERDQKYQIFSEDTFVVVASRVGMQDQEIRSGKVKSLITMDFGNGPHSVVVTGALHFTEAHALGSLTQNIDEPIDNSQNAKRVEAQMVERYAPKAKHAVEQMRRLLNCGTSSSNSNKGIFEVLDNAEYYIADAERFLRQRKFELAVLSMGYAEGLIDALHYEKGINPWDA